MTQNPTWTSGGADMQASETPPDRHWINDCDREVAALAGVGGGDFASSMVYITERATAA